MNFMTTFILFGLNSFSAVAGEAAFSGINSEVYFFKDGEYVRQKKGKNTAESGYPKPINETTWPGLTPYRYKITAALTDGNNGVFFLSDGRYITYDLKEMRILPGYPKEIANSNWNGLSPYAKNISAAIKYNAKYVYFFLTDGRYILYNLKSREMPSKYPKYLDGSEWKGLCFWL